MVFSDTMSSSAVRATVYPRAIYSMTSVSRALRRYCSRRTCACLERRSVSSKSPSKLRLPRPRGTSACEAGSSLRLPAPRPLPSGWPLSCLSTSPSLRVYSAAIAGFFGKAVGGSAGKSPSGAPAARSVRSSSAVSWLAVLFAMRAGGRPSSMISSMFSADGSCRRTRLKPPWPMKNMNPRRYSDTSAVVAKGSMPQIRTCSEKVPARNPTSCKVYTMPPKKP